jgi:thioesterase domain-containing protein
VREVVVLVREDAARDRHLVAYVVAPMDRAPAVRDLRDWLSRHLPEYMMPQEFVLLESLPLTPNGKVDREALPALRQSTGEDAGRSALVPPRDSLEIELARIWEDLLGIPVGVTDDFFKAGGHSLLAVRLMARIRGRLGVELPVSVLFQGATVEHLAGALRRSPGASLRPRLVPIQSGGTRRPLFCVHPAGGQVFCYLELARLLGPEQPFYGLQSPEPSPGDRDNLRLEDMASRYLAEIRSVQPVGPYLLGGWSLGGVIAFEMARQLRERGEEVALLALLDSMPSLPAAEPPDEADLISWFASDLQGLTKERVEVDAGQLRRLPPGELWPALYEWALAARLMPPDLDLEQVRGYFELFACNVAARYRYRALPYEGKVTLFSAQERTSEIDSEEVTSWAGLSTGEIDVIRVPGDHYSMLQPGQVEVLAQRLRGILSDRAAPVTGR